MIFEKSKTLLGLLFLVIMYTSFVSFSGNKTDEMIRSYIDKFDEVAIEESSRSGVPASIKMAQALIESRYGTSNLAVKAHNHFGIKCKVDWEGEKVLADDDAPNECFRKYPSALDSYLDHSDFLKYHRLHFYDHLFEIDKRDYTSWAVGLQHAGYSTTNYYGRSLIHLIEKYELYGLDNSCKGWRLPLDQRSNLSSKAKEVLAIKIQAVNTKKTTDVRPGKTNQVPSEANQRIVPEKELPKIKVHTVKQNETMESIANLYSIDIQSLYDYNKLYFGAQPALGATIYLNSEAPNPPATKKVEYEK